MCVCTAASLTAHGMTTLPILIRPCKLIILECALSLRHLAQFAKSSCCQVLLGVLSLQFEKLTFLCDSIDSPTTYLNSLHRSRTGIILPWVGIVVYNPCMLFNFLPETISLRLLRPTELNFGEWCSILAWHQFSNVLFFTESVCDLNFPCHLCEAWFSSKGRRALRTTQDIFSLEKLLTSWCACCPCCEVTFSQVKVATSSDRLSEITVFGMVHIQCYSH